MTHAVIPCFTIPWWVFRSAGDLSDVFADLRETASSQIDSGACTDVSLKIVVHPISTIA